MSKEGQPRPFSDTQRAYRQAVEDLAWGQSKSDRFLYLPDSTSIHIAIATKASYRSIPISVPVDGQKSLPKNLKTHNMAQIYLFGEEDLQGTANYFGLERQNSHRAKRIAVEEVLEAAPQKGYEFSSLNFRKPSSDTTRDQAAIRRGGINVTVRKAVAEGASLQELYEKGFNSGQISSARQVFAKRGEPFQIPTLNNRWGEIISLLKDPVTDPLVARELILEIPRGIYQYYSKNKDGTQAVFVDTSEIARSAGLYPRVRNEDIRCIDNYLFYKRIPIGEAELIITDEEEKISAGTYHFTTANFEQEAVVFLKAAKGERFDQMRKPTVVVLGPKPAVIPNTTEIKKDRKKPLEEREFPSIRQVLGLKQGLPLIHKMKLSEIVGDSPPITIFIAIGGFYVFKKDIEDLRKFIEDRLELLGVTAGKEM